jgi:hypothetical protein
MHREKEIAAQLFANVLNLEIKFAFFYKMHREIEN